MSVDSLVKKAFLDVYMVGVETDPDRLSLGARLAIETGRAENARAHNIHIKSHLARIQLIGRSLRESVDEMINGLAPFDRAACLDILMQMQIMNGVATNAYKDQLAKSCANNAYVLDELAAACKAMAAQLAAHTLIQMHNLLIQSNAPSTDGANSPMEGRHHER